jgi:hypothetical protein
LLTTVASAGLANSGLRLHYPNESGLLPAQTYGVDGERVGAAHLEILTLPDGNILLDVVTGIEGGPRTHATAELSPTPNGELIPVRQESRSFDSDGQPMGLMRIDHKTGIATCEAPGGDRRASLKLPESDRVANVPLNLLFHPLAVGEAKRVNFQLFLCRGQGGPRLLDFEALVAPRVDAGPGERVVEVQYKPDMNLVPDFLLPTFSFWLDGKGDYLAHRIPLYADGPEVLVVRDGILPGSLMSGD